MTINQAYQILYSSALLVLALLMGLMLIRSARGPGAPDRLLSINMLGTMVIGCVLILSALLGELWLVDVALLYTMISLISVLILARVYIPDNTARDKFSDPKQEDDRHA